ncbi:MAG: hypothetical protein KAI47_27465, partial [Deltaproteobacteria bacterium]|nr:hypothetical protein [Deltaproteobacteria bacterium]
MSYYDNIIIGGGVSGLGALTSLVSSDKSTGGNDTVVLFEARESLMYTNTWMKNVQVQDSLHGSHTGESFRKVVLKDITESKAEACIYTGRRVYHVDQASRTIHLRSQAGEQEAH